MAKLAFLIAFTGKKMTTNPNVVAKPIYYCNNNVLTHHFLSANSNKTILISQT